MSRLLRTLLIVSLSLSLSGRALADVADYLVWDNTVWARNADGTVTQTPALAAWADPQAAPLGLSVSWTGDFVIITFNGSPPPETVAWVPPAPGDTERDFAPAVSVVPPAPVAPGAVPGAVKIYSLAVVPKPRIKLDTGEVYDTGTAFIWPRNGNFRLNTAGPRRHA